MRTAAFISIILLLLHVSLQLYRCGGFLRVLVVVVPGGGGGQGPSVSLPLTGTSLCLPVCQTYQRWSRIIPFLPPRRGDPVSPTCPPTRPTRETLPGETDD